MANGKSKSKGSNGVKTNGKTRKSNPQSISSNTQSVPISQTANNARPIQNRLQVMSGSDFFSKVTVSPGLSGIGKVIKAFSISPSSFVGTRLAQLSELYEFYRFQNLTLRWVPAVPTTLACQFVLYVDLDPADNPSIIVDEDSLVRQAVAQTGSRQWNFHVPQRISMALRADRQLFFTGSDAQNVRFSQQGRAYLIQVTNPVNFNGDNIAAPIEAGSLFIDWNVAFSVPQINASALVSVPRTTTWQQEYLLSVTDVGDNEAVRITGLVPNQYYVLAGTMSCSFGGGNYLYGMTFVDENDNKTNNVVFIINGSNSNTFANYQTGPVGAFSVIQASPEGTTDYIAFDVADLTVISSYLVIKPVYTLGITTPIRSPKRLIQAMD